MKRMNTGTCLNIALIICILSPGLLRGGDGTGGVPLTMRGGKAYFELTSGSQQWSPESAARWSFRIGGGAHTLLGSRGFLTTQYSISGIRHARDEDIPQTLATHFQFGGGWVFEDRYARHLLIPILSVGHVSDRIMPRRGETILQFDGWGIGAGVQARRVVHNSFNPGAGTPSSAFWSSHYVQFDLHHHTTERAYTAAKLSYNIFFDGYLLTFFGEYNTLEYGPRGWLTGIEFGFSWFRYRER